MQKSAQIYAADSRELERQGIERLQAIYKRLKWLEMDADSFEATVPDKRHADMKIYIAAYRRGIKISITRTSPDHVRATRVS